MADNMPIFTKLQRARSASTCLELTGAQFRDECLSALEILEPFIDRARNSPACLNQFENETEKLSIHNDTSQLGLVKQLILTQLEGGIETASGNFMGYIPGDGLLSGALADLVTSVTNRYSGFNFTAPGAAQTENEVIRWMCELFCLGPDAWGSLTSGATMATLNCFLAARETVKDVPTEKLVIYLSNQSHHAINRTLKTLSLHQALIHTVETDDSLRMRPDKLLESIRSHKRLGYQPFLIVASAGTTNTGAIDPLDKLATISREFGMWFHVDAAYGGFFSLCSEFKHVFKGIELADSVVVDPHKGLFLPYGVGAGLVRNHQILKNALHEDAPYLSHEESPLNRSPADYSFELTRHNRAPRVKLTLDMFGVHALAAALTEKLLLSLWLYSQLVLIPGLTVFEQPQLTVVAFRASSEEATENLLKQIMSNGITHVSSTRFHGNYWIRVCIQSFRTHF